MRERYVQIQLSESENRRFQEFRESEDQAFNKASKQQEEYKDPPFVTTGKILAVSDKLFPDDPNTTYEEFEEQGVYHTICPLSDLRRIFAENDPDEVVIVFWPEGVRLSIIPCYSD